MYIRCGQDSEFANGTGTQTIVGEIPRNGNYPIGQLIFSFFRFDNIAHITRKKL
jgi:hypothetical protein